MTNCDHTMKIADSNSDGKKTHCSTSSEELVDSNSDAHPRPSLLVNATIVLHLDNCDILILVNPTVSNIKNEVALQGLHVPWNSDGATASLDQQHSYGCGGNIYWVHMSHDTQPHVPRQLPRVAALAQHFFSQPRPFPGGVVVPLDKGGVPQCRALQAVSPPELRYALGISEGPRCLSWVAN